MRAVDGSNTVLELGPPTTPGGGISSQQPAVASASTLVKWQSTVGGRSGKGRTYIPGLAAANVTATGRTLPAAEVTRVQTALNTYLAFGHGAAYNLDPCVLSFTNGSAALITSGAVQSVIGTQRRRMR